MKAFLDVKGVSEEEPLIEISGSKSESNRLLILQALYPTLKIENLSDSDDSIALQNALKSTSGIVDIGHAGTAMRFLTAYYAIQENSEIILTGSSRMKERPIGVLVQALQDLGADIEYMENQGFPPLRIKGKKLQKKEVFISADTSSQFISALMLIAPKLPNGLTINLQGEVSSKPYIEMTLSLMQQVGISGEMKQTQIHIPACNRIQDTSITVESDWSSASYFYSLVALSEDLTIILDDFRKDSFQGDSLLASIYRSFGVQTEFNSLGNGIRLSKIEVDLPSFLYLDLINTPDLAQTIAVTCFGLGIACRLTGLHTLKIKETDRLIALKAELEKLGAVVDVDDNSLSIEASESIEPDIVIDTYEDHRMAMAFAPLAAKVPVIINDPGVVTKSYPRFWEDLKLVGIQVEVK